MSDDDVDYANVDWTEIEEELEALEFIFPEEMTIHSIKPWKIDVIINSSSEPDDNYLKMLLIMEVPHDYPNNIPFMRLKNLSPDYLNNANLDQYETEIRALARENVGMQMIFMVADHLREQIANINDTVLGKFNKIVEAREEQERLDSAPVTSNMNNLDYTPVNVETFGKWCKEFLENLRAEEQQQLTEQDLRKTGKELFLEKQGLDLLALEEMDLGQEDADVFEEEKNASDGPDYDEGQALYDKNLFAAEEIDEEDVDFD